MDLNLPQWKVKRTRASFKVLSIEVFLASPVREWYLTDF